MLVVTSSAAIKTLNSAGDFMSKIDQSHATGGRDVIGGDSNSNNTYNSITLPSRTKVEQLLYKLKHEIENEEEIKNTIEQLARYQFRKSKDGIDGLQNKLNAGNRGHKYERAIEQKEMFAKLLDRYAMFHSAQHLFAHFLAEVEDKFNSIIYPEIELSSESEVAERVSASIVKPIVNECGAEVITLDHNIVSGMIYWLAELCFVRWHK